MKRLAVRLKTKSMPFFIILLFLIGCESKSPYDSPLSSLKDWEGEVREFPLKFAPNFKYKGKEFIKYAPGWKKNNQTDFFSYVLLWDIDKNPELNASELEFIMEVYYDGLINSKLNKKPGTEPGIPVTKAFFEEINPNLFVGKVLTYDFLNHSGSVELNITVETQECSKDENFIILYKISPKEIKNPLWKKLNKVNITTICKK